MFRWARRKGIDKFELELNDGTSYIRDVIDASPRAAWQLSRVTHLLAAVLVEGFCVAASAAAQVLDQPPAVSVYTLTPSGLRPPWPPWWG